MGEGTLKAGWLIRSFSSVPLVFTGPYGLPGMALPTIRLAAALAVVLTALITACASAALNRYEPPPSTAAAAYLVNQGGLAASARFPMVDGKETPSFGRLVRVAPGIHKLDVQCYHFEIANVTPGIWPYVPIIVDSKTKLAWFSVTGRLSDKQEYYARCIMIDGKPFGFIAASPDGPPVPGFE